MVCIVTFYSLSAILGGCLGMWQQLSGALAVFSQPRGPFGMVRGLVAGMRGLLAMGAFLLSRGCLITMEASGHSGHPPSTHLDAIVNVVKSNLT